MWGGAWCAKGHNVLKKKKEEEEEEIGGHF